MGDSPRNEDRAWIFLSHLTHEGWSLSVEERGRWRHQGRGIDVAFYQVLRGLDGSAPATDAHIGTVTYVAGQSSYSFPDTVPSGGTIYCYSVKAIDTATPPNVSAASERVSVRARAFVTNPAEVTSVSFYLDDRGPLSRSIDGLGGQIDGANVEAEDDDILAAKITFATGDSAQNSYRIYRKGPTELRFTAVGPPITLAAATFDFYDTTIAK